jgi:NRPS condensation-like uncharacterized protein
MTDNPTRKTSADSVLKIKISKTLVDRVQNHCRKHNITVDDFILDAVTAKLRLENKERRKRQRL